VIRQPPLPIDSSGHWFTMQIGMTLGFVTSWAGQPLALAQRREGADDDRGRGADTGSDLR
jgi:hypothetical protein